MRTAAAACARQLRRCHGPWDWCTLKEEELAPPMVPLPEDLPKFPGGVHNPNPETTPGGKPYVTPADFEDWEKKYRKWFETAGPQTLRDGTPFELKPYENHEVHQKYLESLKTMTDDEKKLIGATIHTDRTQNYAVQLSRDHSYEVPVAAIHLQRHSDPILKKHNWTDHGTIEIRPHPVDKDGKLITQWQSCNRQFDKGNVAKNYMRELEEVLASRQAEKEGAKEAISEASN